MTTMDSLKIKVAGASFACVLLAGCFGSRDTLVREPVVPDQLQNVSDRISDEAIQSDHQVIEGLRARLRKLNERGDEWPMDNYYVCKAQAWIDFAETEYTDNDRGKVVDHALDEARKLIVQMEASAKNISRDTRVLPESMVIRKDLWDFVAQRKVDSEAHCTDCDLARLEVQLVSAGHDHAELGWRHAASGVLASERLARAVKVGAQGCAIKDKADDGGLVLASAVGVGDTPAGQGSNSSLDDLRVPVVVHFAYDKSGLSNETTAVLARAAQVMREYPQITVTLVGHTDARASREYNNALSLRRAAAVRAYLISTGISNERITEEGRGKSQPLNVAAPEIQARALDRRVELRFGNLPLIDIKTIRQDADVQADH